MLDESWREFWAYNAGIWHFLRLLISLGMFGLAAREIFFRQKNGIMTGFLIAAVGLFIASIYSVSDVLAMLVPTWKQYSATANPVLRIAVIGNSTMLFDIGGLIIIRWLLWPKPEPKKPLPPRRRTPK